MRASETELFKTWLISHLRMGPTTVIFTKKDGSDRVMECTLLDELIPPAPVKEDVEKKERKVNPDVLAVYDLKAKAWKSFRFDSIKQVSFSL